MMEAVRQLQYDKSKSVAKAAQDTFQMLQHVNARPSLPPTDPCPHSSATSASFTSPPCSTPSPPLSLTELPAWPSEPPRACTVVERRTNFQEALCLFSEVAGLSDNMDMTADVPAPLPTMLAASAAAPAALVSLLRPPRPRISPPGMLTRPPQFFPLHSPPKVSPQSVDLGRQPAAFVKESAEAHLVLTETALVAGHHGALSHAGSGASAVDASLGISAREDAAPAVECSNSLSRAPESPVFAAVSFSPTDQLPLIPHDWSCCTLDAASCHLADDDRHVDGAAFPQRAADDAAVWRSEFTDAEVADMLREVEHDERSPSPAPAVEDNAAPPVSLPAAPLCDKAFAHPAAPRPTRSARTTRVGVALGGAAVFAVFTVMWRAWQASNFENIV
jgi:hypothetical protein